MLFIFSRVVQIFITNCANFGNNLKENLFAIKGIICPHYFHLFPCFFSVGCLIFLLHKNYCFILFITLFVPKGYPIKKNLFSEMNDSEHMKLWMFISKCQFWVILITVLISLLLVAKAFYNLMKRKRSNYFVFLISIIAANVLTLLIILFDIFNFSFKGKNNLTLNIADSKCYLTCQELSCANLNYLSQIVQHAS